MVVKAAFVALVLVGGCKRGPAPAIECGGFDRSLGVAPGVLTVHPGTVFKWSCDGKSWEVGCHLEDAKHACTCTHTTSSGTVSTDQKFAFEEKLPENEADARSF